MIELRDDINLWAEELVWDARCENENVLGMDVRVK